MSPISRRRFAVTFALLSAGLAAGCASPTLPPLPPPSRPSLIVPAGQGEVLVEGSVPVAETRVMVLNTQTRRIFGELTTNHTYSIVVKAEAGDTLQLSYSSGDHSSPAVEFDVPEEEAASETDADGGVE